MIGYYLKLAYRNLMRHKLFTLLNLLGMAIGVASCLLIAVYVSQELSYDTFHPHADRVWRMGFQGKMGTQEMDQAVTSPDMAGDIRNDFSEIEATLRVAGNGMTLMKTADGTTLKDPDVVVADTNFFQFFGFELLEGNPAQVLRQPSDVVLTVSLARKLFPGTSAIGQTLTLDNRMPLRVSGIAADPPRNSHLYFTAVVSQEYYEQFRRAAIASGQYESSWLSNMGTSTYVRLREGVEGPAFFVRLNRESLVRRVEKTIQKYMGMSLLQLEQSGQRMAFSAHPLLGIHLDAPSDRSFGVNGSGPGDRRYVQFFIVVGLFILIIACVNFINLSTARAVERTREVGVRKVLGSDRRQLIQQFLAESLLLAAAAVLAGWLLAEAALPFLDRLAGTPIAAGWMHSLWLLPVGLAVVGVLGLLAGSYPAVFLAGFPPLRMLAGSKGNGGKDRVWLRSGLVVLQFGLSILLVIATLSISDQLRYLRTRDLGFNASQLMVIKDVWTLNSQSKALAMRDELARVPGVESITLTDADIGVNAALNNTSLAPVGDLQNTRIVTLLSTDGRFGNTTGLRLLTGRDLNPQNQSDSNSVVLNQTAAREFGWTPDQALGKWITYLGENEPKYQVVGVAQDFFLLDSRQPLKPVAMFLRPSRSRLVLRLASADISATLQGIEDVWKQNAAGLPFDYEFLNDRFNVLYRAEERLANVFGVFAGLAILIACLGLFGLATFMAQRREKEIGIRKVLGASVGSILWLFASRFAFMVGVAFLPAVAMAWYFLGQWLTQFPYRTALSPFSFVLAGLLALGVALGTILPQAWRAANTNPVRALKSE